MANLINGKMKRRTRGLVEGIAKITVPSLLVLITFYFLATVQETDDIMFKIIKYSIYALDFIAGVIIVRGVVGILYDLDILKTKRHREKIKEDE